MFSGCDSLTSVAPPGEKFSFVGSRQASLPGDRWLSSVDGKAYSGDAAPGCVAATYTAQKGSEPEPARADFSGAEAMAVQTYTGSALAPSVTIKLDGKAFSGTTRYNVKNANKANAVTAAVTVTGMGGYAGAANRPYSMEAFRTLKERLMAGRGADNAICVYFSLAIVTCIRLPMFAKPALTCKLGGGYRQDVFVKPSEKEYVDDQADDEKSDAHGDGSRRDDPRRARGGPRR
ncbi:hypothetical protein [Paratractidigestivibacter sp.]|uniref:hypothetical protein n=2 Tax=Paratractidigestivibacter sp. TaxID=2847316 RepID=UPI002AC97865|nr:hypothetical protein [Paratractidigestivibacter sp.]